MVREQAVYESPLGQMLLQSEEDFLTGAWFVGQAHFPQELLVHQDEWKHQSQLSDVLCEAMAWLDRYFSGVTFGSMPPLKPQGTPFRMRVWEILLEIPYGETSTYGRIAQRLGDSHSSEIDSLKAVDNTLTCPRKNNGARAVGGAVGHNPISIFIPCHRVVGAGGKITGYAGGLWRKQLLLDLETRVIK